MYSASSYNYVVQRSPQGILLCDKSALHAMCVLQRGFDVNNVTHAFLGSYATYAPSDFVYYVDVVEFLQKNPTYNNELASYLKTYANNKVYVFDLTAESTFVTELDNVVRFFETGRPNPTLIKQPVPNVLSHVRLWVSRDAATTPYTIALQTMQRLSMIAYYELCRVITAESALEILQVVYREYPQTVARLLSDFSKRKLLLFGLFTTEDRSPLAVFELRLRKEVDPPLVILLPRDKRRLLDYVLDGVAFNLPDAKADRKLIMAELQTHVPKALDFLYRSYKVRVSLKDFCQTRSGSFQFLQPNPVDGHATFQDVSVVGGKYRLPDGFSCVSYNSLTVSGCSNVLLPETKAESVVFDRCKAVSITKLTAKTARVAGGLYGDLTDMKNITCKLTGDFEVESLDLVDVTLGRVSINAKTLSLTNVRNVKLTDKDNKRLINCQRLSLNTRDHFNINSWRFPALRELELNTFDDTQVVGLEVERQFPSLSKLTLRCGVLGTIGHLDSVVVYAAFGQPIPDIDADVVTVYATNSWLSSVRCKTLKLVYHPELTRTTPSTINVPSRTEFMYSGPQRYLGTRDFITNVYVHPTNVAQWKGARLVAANIYFYFDAKLVVTKNFEDFFSNFIGNVHIVLSEQAQVPRASTLSTKFKFWKLSENTKPNVDSWDDMRQFITFLKPVKDV